jgi:hypothetical protein
MTDRSEYATAKDGDVLILLSQFEKGVAFTKEQALRDLGIPDRRFRAAVAKLREQGEPIVSWSEEGSTYRMARDAQEAERFIDQELLPRIRHLERQARHIRIGIGVRFKVHQERLIS